ncbi:MAG: hypothetical protein JNM07_04035 [Phycisphaerae bacterium]|nr:hypothetical protein [Phycisphaerae bacterium]
MNAADEFYIGWSGRTPAGYARWSRLAASVLIVSALVGGLTLLGAQRDPGPGTWDPNATVTLVGRVRADPGPILLIDAVEGDGRVPARAALLVSTGKFGAAGRVANMTGDPVRVRGTLINRGGFVVIELVDGAEAVTAASSAGNPEWPVEDLGIRTVRGEIVDPKCYSGAMKPGEGKVHRACAVRCLSGGITPVLVGRDESGLVGGFVLAGPRGEAINQRVLEFVADPIVVAGRVERHGGPDGVLVMRIDPAAIRRQ